MTHSQEQTVCLSVACRLRYTTRNLRDAKGALFPPPTFARPLVWAVIQRSSTTSRATRAMNDKSRPPGPLPPPPQPPPSSPPNVPRSSVRRQEHTQRHPCKSMRSYAMVVRRVPVRITIICSNTKYVVVFQTAFPRETIPTDVAGVRQLGDGERDENFGKCRPYECEKNISLGPLASCSFLSARTLPQCSTCARSLHNRRRQITVFKKNIATSCSTLLSAKNTVIAMMMQFFFIFPVFSSGHIPVHM